MDISKLTRKEREDLLMRLLLHLSGDWSDTNDPVMVLPADKRNGLPEYRAHYEHRLEQDKHLMREAIRRQLNSDKDRDNDPDQDD